jgi:nicotinamide-nucleotide amidase
VSATAGIVVTGTEVLTGRVSDRNGPWLSERLRELGVDHSYTVVVGDRREDMDEALRFLAARGVDLMLTSGGLGPTADDLTAEVVGAFAGRAMVLDDALEERIAEILKPLMSRWPDLDPDAIRASNRKQAIVPEGATVLDPVGTAPGLVVPVDGGPTVVVLPGPPRELHAMWPAAVATDAFRAAIGGAVELRQETLRLFGIPESEIAETLRLAEDAHGLEGLEITTCLRRGEVEVVTRFSPDAASVYAQFVSTVRERHERTLFSEDGRTVDQQVADMLRSRG